MTYVIITVTTYRREKHRELQEMVTKRHSIMLSLSRLALASATILPLISGKNKISVRSRQNFYKRLPLQSWKLGSRWCLHQPRQANCWGCLLLQHNPVRADTDIGSPIAVRLAIRWIYFLVWVVLLLFRNRPQRKNLKCKQYYMHTQEDFPFLKIHDLKVWEMI